MKSIVKGFKEIHHQFTHLESNDKKNILIASITLFFALFSYPLIRSAATALLIENYGAKSTPLVWLLSVILLAVFVSLINFFQTKKSIGTLFNWVVISSTIVMLASVWGTKFNIPELSYLYAIWKEVYIVIVVHLTLGFLNSVLDFKVAKVIYGPLGAIGSFGGILGGVITSSIMKTLGVHGVATLGLGILIMSVFVFGISGKQFLKKKEETPITSLGDKKLYVALICLLIICSQFVINLANFKFNLGLEAFSDAASKGAYLGKIYSYINTVSLTVQLFLIPLAFKFLRVNVVHILIPIIYLGLIIFDLMDFMGLIGTSILFVAFKGLDYSIFSAAKEMLYFPLTQSQKYGAKYIVDMIVYRSAKMGISALLLVFTSLAFIQNMLVLSAVIWVVLAIYMTFKFKDLKFTKE